MLLGREQASGYVEDTATDPVAVAEIIIDSAGWSRPAPVPAPAVVLEPAQSAG